jgi:hypothetical protein
MSFCLFVSKPVSTFPSTVTCVVRYLLRLFVFMYLLKLCNRSFSCVFQDIEYCFTIDKRVSAKINQLYSFGVKRLVEMRRHLKVYIEQDLFNQQTTPPSSDTRFWPTNRTLLNHMFQASKKLRFCNIKANFVHSTYKTFYSLLEPCYLLNCITIDLFHPNLPFHTPIVIKCR